MNLDIGIGRALAEFGACGEPLWGESAWAEGVEIVVEMLEEVLWSDWEVVEPAEVFIIGCGFWVVYLDIICGADGLMGRGEVS